MNQIAHAFVLHRDQLQGQVWRDDDVAIPHGQHYTVGWDKNLITISQNLR